MRSPEQSSFSMLNLKKESKVSLIVFIMLCVMHVFQKVRINVAITNRAKYNQHSDAGAMLTMQINDLNAIKTCCKSVIV